MDCILLERVKFNNFVSNLWLEVIFLMVESYLLYNYEFVIMWWFFLNDMNEINGLCNVLKKVILIDVWD